MQLRKPLSFLLIAMFLLSTSVVLLPAELALASEGPIFESSHGGDDHDEMGDSVTYVVRIENISGDSDLPTPFAPGVWVLHSEPGALFIEGEADKGYGLEALAEDGDPSALAEALNGMDLHAGVFNTPVGADGPGVILPGQAYEFEVKVTADAPYLSFATMFVQSNDLFVGPGEAGIALIDMDGMAMEGMHDVTADLELWDAGTEANEEPGVGGDQAPRQSGPNSGLPEIEGTVRVVDDGYSYPAVSALVKVSIDKAMMMEAGMEKDDEMMSDKDDKMMSDKEGMMGEIMLMEEGDTPYTVAAGDTLGSIARRAYGASKYWEVVCSANGLANCNLIHIGDELMLPSHADAMAKMDMMMMGEKDGMMGEKDEMMSDKDDEMMSDKDDEMMSDKDDEMMSDKDGMMKDDGMMMGDIMLMEDGDTPYTVVAGDTLGAIAKRAYGDVNYWKAICGANEIDNCDRIDIGDELLLPTQAEAEEMMGSMMMDDGMDAMEKKDDM